MKIVTPIIVLVVLLLAAAWYVTSMPDRSHTGPLPPLTDDERAIQRNLERHVGRLAGEIGERNLWRYDALLRARDHVRADLQSLRFEVHAQPFDVQGRTVENLEVRIPGTRATREVVVAGAHYDSERGTPGADDNASGVAALLEIARLLRGRSFARTVALAFFVNEESPFFTTGDMGSRVYARRARAAGVDVRAMLSIESIGYYADEKGSQHYPPALGLAYPDAGNFLAFIGNLSSRDLVRRAIASFRTHTRFPSEGIAAPESIPGVGWSDHSSFWAEGYPAIMLTDTVPYRNPNYHLPSDVPETLDFERLARVTAGIARVIADLAGES
jgi:hypothetical protein